MRESFYRSWWTTLINWKLPCNGQEKIVGKLCFSYSSDADNSVQSHILDSILFDFICLINMYLVSLQFYYHVFHCFGLFFTCKHVYCKSLHTTMVPHSSHWNVQLGSLCTSEQPAAPALQSGGGVSAEWLFSSVSCSAAEQSRRFHVSPYAWSLRNLPACYEHEVNKTLGHHKSRANDMSGAEISLHRQSAKHGSHVSRPAALQLLLSSQVPMCKIIITIGAQLR